MFAGKVYSFQIADTSNLQGKHDTLLRKGNSYKEFVSDTNQHPQKKHKNQEKEKALSEKNKSKEPKEVIHAPAAALVKIPVKSQPLSKNGLADTTQAIGKTQKSLFTDHLCSTVTIQPRIHPKNDQFWISAVLLLAFIIYVWLKVLYRRPLRKMLDTFIYKRGTTELARDENSASNRASIFFSLLFVIILSLFIYQSFSMNNHYYLETQIKLGLYLLICAGVILTYFIKVSTVNLLAFLFNAKGMGAEYVYNILLFNKVLGLFLFPITLFIAYFRLLPTYYFLYSGYLLILLMFVYRSVRILIIGIHNSKISKLYLFLYLCTLEFLPLIVLVKLFICIL